MPQQALRLWMVRWVDEREHFFDRLIPIQQLTSPLKRLEGYVTTWLDYLPCLYPVPGHLARARRDDAATAAWGDRMCALEVLYQEPIRQLHETKALHTHLGVNAAVDAIRATASVHAWEHLVHDRGWSQQRTVQTLWRAAQGAILKTSA
jgi:hypothetical protein